MSASQPDAVRASRAAPALRSRYLAALGVTEWVQRGLAPEPAQSGSTLPEREAVPEMPAVQAPSAATSVSAAPVSGTTGEAEALRALVDETPRSSAQGEADRGAAATTESAPPEPAPPGTEPVPRFRLTVLELEGALLVVDDALFEALPDRRRALAPLGDLLRAAHLLRGRSVDARVGTRVFHWPQVEGDAMDQSLPRAVEALQAYAERRTDAAGFVLRIAPAASAGPSVRAVLAALDALERPCATLDPAFLEAADARARRAAWAALWSLVPSP